MLLHIVLLQPHIETSLEEINTALEHVQALRETIPGIIDAKVGKNSSGNHQGYEYGFVMRFVDQDALNAYAPHPAHRVVSDELVRICDRIIDFDLNEEE
jgi:antibiotic biosynthesis monooxygenase (ABM) superfamily enzyme